VVVGLTGDINRAATNDLRMYYNFVRIHQTRRITPAMAAGATDKLWDMSDVVRLVEEFNAATVSAKRNERTERSYNPFGDALGGHGLQSK